MRCHRVAEYREGKTRFMHFWKRLKSKFDRNAVYFLIEIGTLGRIRHQRVHVCGIQCSRQVLKSSNFRTLRCAYMSSIVTGYTTLSSMIRIAMRNYCRKQFFHERLPQPQRVTLNFGTACLCSSSTVSLLLCKNDMSTSIALQIILFQKKKKLGMDYARTYSKYIHQSSYQLDSLTEQPSSASPSLRAPVVQQQVVSNSKAGARLIITELGLWKPVTIRSRKRMDF